MTAVGIRTWSAIHTWSSLLSTLFLLMLCITGLPLIFADEIHHWTDDHRPKEVRLTDGRPASVDSMVVAAKQAHGGIATRIVFDNAESELAVFTAPSWEIVRREESTLVGTSFDSISGRMMEGTRPMDASEMGVMDVILKLHLDLFIGFPGQLFLGGMGFLFLTAIVSGVVLYGPFTRKLAFGTIRQKRSRRVRWLDWHNLLGIVTFSWAAVVGATGVLNELSFPLYERHLATDVAAVIERWKGMPQPEESTLASVDGALAAARRAVPDSDPYVLIYPGNRFGTPHHYLIWMQGRTRLTSELHTTVLVDGVTGKLIAVVPQPWYLKAVQISRPLHFGDYGGLPLKIIWALLDIVTIIVLGSGLFLWITRSRRTAAREAPRISSEAQWQPGQ